jgi:hypothetical protein
VYKKDRTPRCAAPKQGKPKAGGKTTGTKETEEGTRGSDQFKAKVGARRARPEDRKGNILNRRF